MSEIPAGEMRQALPGDRRLGVLGAMGMAWQLLMSDFWPIWLVGLVAYAIEMGANAVGSAVGSIPIIGIIGGCISLAIAIFVQPALAVGLVFAIRRRIDGGRADINDLFEGFRQRYWQSVVAMLPPLAVALVTVLLCAAIIGVTMGLAGAFDGHARDEDMAIAGVIAGVLSLPVIVIAALVSLLFTFNFLAVWDHPESGWAAVGDSVRTVMRHFFPVLGLAILFTLIGLAALLVGGMACCVGILFTIPLVTVWETATLIYLYRAWTGRPLAQESGSPAPAGPIAPTSIEPPGSDG